MGRTIELSDAAEKFLSELAAGRSTMDPGFSRRLNVDPSMSLREWIVQGKAVRNECNVSVELRFNEQSGEPYTLRPGGTIKKVFSRIFVTYNRDTVREPAEDGMIRSFSSAEVDYDGEALGAESAAVNPIVMAAPTNVTVGVASGLVLAANPARKFLSAHNTDATKTVSIGFDGNAAEVNKGVVIPPGQFRAIHSPGEAPSVGSVFMISSGAGTVVALQEGS